MQFKMGKTYARLDQILKFINDLLTRLWEEYNKLQYYEQTRYWTPSY